MVHGTVFSVIRGGVGILVQSNGSFLARRAIQARVSLCFVHVFEKSSARNKYEYGRSYLEFPFEN
jgi:hypothetical protein